MIHSNFVWAAALAASLLGATGSGLAQPVGAEPEDWREAEVRLPATVNLERVVTFELSRSTSLVFGIEADSLRIDPDGVVRYAFVARSSSGAVNVLFEGIRCQTAEVKLYAHWDQGSGWTSVPASTWQALSFRGATRRAMQMARGGVCAQATPNTSPARILEALRSGTADTSR
jgi:hypothetical protein